MISADNPGGTITNSDFKQAGMLLHLATIAQHHPVAYATILTGCDNTPALACENKGAVSHDGPPSLLCNHGCTQQRALRYCHRGFFLPGEANVMADDASRLQHLSDSALLAHFNQHYPQTKPWVL